jgi:hypothetical protein
MPRPSAPAVRPQARSKYGNVKGQIDGVTFDSKAEGTRYLLLRSRERLGEIRRLECHPSYALVVNGELICRYRADFAYEDMGTGDLVIEDVKGVKTAVYQIKKKLMKACLDIDIVEVPVR